LRKDDRLSVFVLLSLIGAMNASQAMVLCVGCDGRVAVERLGHDHCADGTHKCESDAAVHDTTLIPGSGGTRCGGCTDISMADAIGSDPRASSSSKIISAGLLAILPAVQDPAADPGYIGLPVSACLDSYHIPLGSIVLLV
jgi:hypothetical protein